MKQRVATLLVVFVVGFGYAPAAFPQQPDKRIEQLQKEREKLTRVKDPVDRTKTQIKISEILVSLIADAVKDADMDKIQQQLNEYCTAIQDAQHTMMSTGRDANRHPSGFKDLEIALRKQIVRLKEYAQSLTYDQREPVNKAVLEAETIKDRLIKALLIQDVNAKTGKS